MAQLASDANTNDANDTDKKAEKRTFIREYDFNPKLAVSKLELHQDPHGLWSGGIGATVWDAAIVLSKYLEANSESLLKGKAILEIGSGTGVVGMVCAKLGAKSVLFTDQKCAMPLLNKNLFENYYKHYALKADQESKDSEEEKETRPLLLSHVLQWGSHKHMEALCRFLSKHFGKYECMVDLVIMSDCIYCTELHQALVDTLQSVVAFIAKHNRNKKLPQILMSTEVRKEKEEQCFYRLMADLHWKYEKVDLHCIDPMYVCDELEVYSITPTAN